MKIGDTETKTGGGLEPTRWGVHSDCGRGEGIVGWEHQSSPILAIVIWGLFRTGDYVVPSVGCQPCRMSA